MQMGMMWMRNSGVAASIAVGGLLLVGACGADNGTAPAWDPELGGSSGGAATDGETADADTTGMNQDGGGGESCSPGEVVPCGCADGLSVGEQVCLDDGSGFGSCDCDDEMGTTGDEPGGSTGDEPEGDVVCYPGEANDFSTCVPLHRFDEMMPAGYEYPDAYMGDENYRPPIALIDLEEVAPGTMLAPNFRLDEIAQLKKGRYAVVQPHAIVSLQALRDEVGAIGVNSGYRSPAYNAGLAGSATYSRHMYGDAYDLDPLAVSIDTLEGVCTANGGMLVEYTSHVHCDFRFDPVDEEFYGPAMAASPGRVEPPAMSATLVQSDDGVWTAPAEGFDEGEPQRRWTARDAAGAVVGQAVGGSFVAPVGAATVEVRVGTQVERSASVGSLAG